MRVRGLLAVAAVGVVVLAGCADRQEGNDTLPTASTSAEASPTFKPLGPPDFPVPAEAREQTASGATAMTTYYLNLVDRISAMLATPTFDAQPIRDLSSECTYCETLAASLENINQRGESFTGGTWTLSGVDGRLTDDTTAETVVLISEAASSTVDSQGTVVANSSYPAAQLSGGLVLSWDEPQRSWTVMQFDLTRV